MCIYFYNIESSIETAINVIFFNFIYLIWFVMYIQHNSVSVKLSAQFNWICLWNAFFTLMCFIYVTRYKSNFRCYVGNYFTFPTLHSKITPHLKTSPRLYVIFMSVFSSVIMISSKDRQMGEKEAVWLRSDVELIFQIMVRLRDYVTTQFRMLTELSINYRIFFMYVPRTQPRSNRILFSICTNFAQ